MLFVRDLKQSYQKPTQTLSQLLTVQASFSARDSAHYFQCKLVSMSRKGGGLLPSGDCRLWIRRCAQTHGRARTAETWDPCAPLFQYNTIFRVKTLM